ncbi:MAG: hypothetical protein MSA79_05210 [Campylobacter sp.]|nr:hypothetical protein [Campylobacter sp.]
MANTITNSLSSLNNFFGGVNSQKNSTGNALASFNQALAGGGATTKPYKTLLAN